MKRLTEAERKKRRKERNRRYYEAHREEAIAYALRWGKEHPEARREANKRYYEKNREELNAGRREYRKAYYEAHREELKAHQRKYYYDRHQNEAFRAWMQETGTTQQALAEKAGVSRAAISTWCTGSAPVNLKKIRAALPELADYLEKEMAKDA